jgi:hypothetical protein
MHFRVQTVVRLSSPLTIAADTNANDDTSSVATGYVIVLGVNAPDRSTALSLARESALSPRSAPYVHDHVKAIEEMEAESLDKSDWEEEVLELVTNIDKQGVYYSSGLIFFNHDSP